MKLIDKDALVAEIERRKHKLLDNIICERDKEWVVRTAHQLNRIILFIDTSEVKEVDLDAEIVKYEESFKHNPANMGYKETAKHFFELGFQASNPLTWEDIKTIQNISGEVYAEVAKGKDDFYSIYPIEQSFLEEVLK